MFRYLYLMVKLTAALWLCCVLGQAQNIKVEYDKNRDFTGYKTYQFGEGEIITPTDQRLVPDASLHSWVRTSVQKELTGKGLQQVDSAAHLVVSYIIGALPRSDVQDLGPMGMIPGDPNQTWSRSFQQGSLIIDLHDRAKNLVWRVNASTTTNAPDAQKMIDEVVAKGFRKFSIQPKRVKKR